MKSKAGLFVLLAEIAAIVILHSAKLSRTEADKAVSQSQTSSVSFQADQKPSVSYTSLK
jgi:hypothetical protein